MKKLLIVATLSIAVAAVIKRVTGKQNTNYTIGSQSRFQSHWRRVAQSSHKSL